MKHPKQTPSIFSAWAAQWQVFALCSKGSKVSHHLTIIFRTEVPKEYTVYLVAPKHRWAKGRLDLKWYSWRGPNYQVPHLRVEGFFRLCTNANHHQPSPKGGGMQLGYLLGFENKQPPPTNPCSKSSLNSLCSLTRWRLPWGCDWFQRGFLVAVVDGKPRNTRFIMLSTICIDSNELFYKGLASRKVVGFYLRARFLWPPPFLPQHGGFIAWLKWFKQKIQWPQDLQSCELLPSPSRLQPPTLNLLRSLVLLDGEIPGSDNWFPAKWWSSDIDYKSSLGIKQKSAYNTNIYWKYIICYLCAIWYRCSNCARQITTLQPIS